MASYVVTAHRPNWIYVKASSPQALDQGIDNLVTFAASPTIQLGTGLTYNGSTKITVGRDGYYEIYAHGAIDGGAAGYSRIVALLVNGSAVHFINNPGYTDGGTGVTWRNQVRYRMHLSAGDEVTVKLRFEDPGAPSTQRDTNPNYDGVALGVLEMSV